MCIETKQLMSTGKGVRWNGFIKGFQYSGQIRRAVGWLATDSLQSRVPFDEPVQTL